MKLKPIIKWSGSKRHQADELIFHFPKRDYSQSTYYEPFVGGGSVLYKVLHSNFNFKQYICSDKCKPLIELWKMIKNDPQYLISYYKCKWEELKNNGSIVFYNIRNNFNKEFLPEQLFFLSRTCINGLIRFNSKGEFNSSFHLNRQGINPDTLKDIVFEWSAKLNEFDVIFVCDDFININPNQEDIIYLDPPYFNTKGMYYGSINHNTLWNYLKKLECTYLLSFDGKSGEVDSTYAVPKELYTSHFYITSGGSSFKRLIKNEIAMVKDSLYIYKK